VYTELMEKETAIAVPETTETVLINPMSVGFYRVHYDAKLFESIIDSVEAGKVKELDKVSLQSNAYALTRAIKTPATSYLELAQAFKNTKEYTVWAGLTAGLGSMNAMFAHEDFKEDLKAYIRAIYPEILEYVGWDTEPGESHTDSLLRSTVLAGAGFNETPSVLEEAKKRFAEHVKGNLIAPDIRGVVFALTAWQGSQPEFETMKELYLKAERAEEKVRLLYSMGDFKEEKVLKQMLEFNLSEHVRSQDAVIGMVSVGSNSFGEELAWNFFKENVDEFYKRYAGGTYTLARLISDVAQGSTQERHDDVENFFKQHPADNAKRAIQQALERIRINKAFMEFNTDKVRAWLVKH
jgi:puromycin-sensitive aminopeptidase